MVRNLPPEARSAWVELRSRTIRCPAANLNGTISATRTGRAAASTPGADASVAETCSFHPCSGERAPTGVARAHGPSTENLHSAPDAARTARAATERSSSTSWPRGAASMEEGIASCGESRGEPGELPSRPPAQRPVASEIPRRAQPFYDSPADSFLNHPERDATGERKSCAGDF